MRSSVRTSMLALALFAGVASAQGTPEAMVKSTADEVVAIMRQNKDPKALIALAEQKILPHFDFSRMTRLAVGRPWREASPAQQRALEDAFRTLLVNTYSTAISNGVTPADKVEVKAAQGSGDDVLVKTIVQRSGKSAVSVDYRLAKNAERWMVYDVVVEDVSLVQTYRASFAAEIGRAGIDGLIRQLEHKSGVRPS